MFKPISELVKLYYVSKASFYVWIKNGSIPADAIRREGAVTCISTEKLDALFRDGTLMQRKRRQLSADDNKTTRGPGWNVEHRWGTENHPYDPRERLEHEKSPWSVFDQPASSPSPASRS